MLSNSLNSGTEKLLEKDRQYVWHPFSPFPDEASVLVERAEGVWLYTSDGRKILDGISSWWVNLFGHGNLEIANAIANQALKLEHVIFAGFTHQPAIDLAEKLISLSNTKFSKIYFSDNGSTSVEVAIKMALHYWYAQGRTRTKIIALEGSYHGDTFGAMSVGARSLFSDPYKNHLFEVDFIPFPDSDNVDLCLKKYEELCASGQVAAFIYEPLLQGTSGMRTYTPEALHSLLSISRQFAVINIADEVFTGFGRTGKNFASDFCSISPDLMCMSKGITGGFLPLGITACNDRIVDVFWNAAFEKLFFHGHSYTGNPIACAAANASIELLKSDVNQQNIQRISNRHQSFSKVIRNYSCISRVDHLGTMLAIEFSTDAKSGYTNSIRHFLYNHFLSNNILLRPLGNVIYLLPPYVITDEELQFIYKVVQQAAEHLQK